MKTIIFIATKPLQLIICMMVRDIFFGEGSKLVLCLVDSFHGARNVVERVKCHDNKWDDVLFFRSRHEAIRYAAEASCDFLFTDSDVGVKIFLSLAWFKIYNRKTRICVYEEGLGTYRDDIYSPLKAWLFNVFGVGAQFGACGLTDDIYIFDKETYVKKAPLSCHKARIITAKLEEYVGRSSCLADIFNVSTALHGLLDSSRDGLCLVYLGSWSVSDSALFEIRQVTAGVKILKLHPHITSEAGVEFYNSFDYVVDPSLPAELLLLTVAERFDRVIVYHHGSSIVRYFQSSGVDFIDLGWNVVFK